MTDRPERWPEQIEGALPAYLGRQRWYGGEGDPPAESVAVEKVSLLWQDQEGERRLWQVLVDVGPDVYQLVLGERPAGEPAEFLHGQDSAVVGAVDSSYFYDATLDGEMSKQLLSAASAGAETASRSRRLSVEQSNTSVVYDDRLIFKIFRHLLPGRNPDVEVTTALARAGFVHVAQPALRWGDERYDFGFAQQYLSGGSEGWALALTSLRDLYNSAGSGPSDAGGDFAAEGRRLGQVTAEMHVAMSEVFPLVPGAEAAARWSDLVGGLEGRLADVGVLAGTDLTRRATRLVRRLRSVTDPGPAIRVHGDFHLGQVMRTDAGWCVLDFEGEPVRPVEDRTAPISVFKDVTSMLRSFHYASRHAILERAAPDREELEPLARSWEMHNREAFLDGYYSNERISLLLPDPAVVPLVMTAYELDKALYEVAYERDYRPDWVSIPLDALERLLAGTHETRAGL